MPGFVSAPGYTTSGAQHQCKRGLHHQLITFTGAQGEPFFDTVFNRIAMQDGSQAGGWPHALASVQTSTGSVTISNSIAMMMVFSSANAPTITLPSQSNYPQGQRLVVWDAGGFSTAFNITITSFSTTSPDKIWVSSGVQSTSITITVAGRHAAFIPINSTVFGVSSTRGWLLESTL